MPVPTPQREYTSAALEALIFRVTFSRSYTGRPDFSSGYLICKVWNIRKQRSTERMKKDKTPKPMVLGTWSGHLSEVSERCHPCPARFSLVCTGRAHSRFWNKPFALKTPDHLFLLQKKPNLEGPETNCCSAKGRQYSRIAFSDLSNLGRGKQTGFLQNQDTDQCSFSALFMIFRWRERNCSQDYVYCGMRLVAEVEEPPQVKKRWALLPSPPPHRQLKVAGWVSHFQLTTEYTFYS